MDEKIAGVFTIDNTELYEGYTDGRTWNGWEMPWFKLDIALKVAEKIKDEKLSIKYDVKQDKFYIKSPIFILNHPLMNVLLHQLK